MNPAAIFQQTRDAGLRIRLEGDSLAISPPARLSVPLRELIKQHKASLIAFLCGAEDLTGTLVAAAMRRCDEFGDGPEAREQMRQDCINMPPELRRDLLDHFLSRGGGRP